MLTAFGIALLATTLATSCTTQAPPADCTAEVAKIAALQQELESSKEQLAQTIAKTIMARAQPTSRHARNPWAERYKVGEDGKLQVFFVNAVTLDENSPVLAVSCKDGNFNVVAMAYDQLPAGKYVVTLRYGDGYQREFTLNNPKADKGVDLPRNVMEDILARESLEIVVTQPGPGAATMTLGPFVLVGIEGHLRNKLWANACGL